MKTKKRFEKGNLIQAKLKHKGKFFVDCECICCDAEIAVFCRVKIIKGIKRIYYKDIFVISNDFTIWNEFKPKR